jgi:hypothetical protein
VWKVVIMHAVPGARLVGYLDGTIKAPPEELSVENDVSGKSATIMEENTAYVAWNEKDQQLMSYLLGSISREVLVQLTRQQTAHVVWKAIQDMFFRSRERGLSICAEPSMI